MATIKGVWKFKDSPSAGTVYSNGGFNYPFICSGVNYTGFSSNNRYYKTSGYPASAGYAHDLFYETASSSVEVWHSYSTYAWKDEKYKTIDFGKEEITVSDAFYAWITASAEYIPYAHDQSITEYKIKAATLVEIADAIREKTGVNEGIIPESMASEIEGIDTAEPWDESFTVKEGAVMTGIVKPLTVTENGTYTAPEGVDGYSPIYVAVQNSEKPDLLQFLVDTTKSLDYVFSNKSALKDDAVAYILANLDTSKVESVVKLFEYSTITKIPLFDTSSVKNFTFMFARASIFSNVPLLDTSKANNLSGMFQYCSRLETVPLFNTSNATIMSNMFSGCKALKSVPLFDTSNAIYMMGFLDNCQNITEIPCFNTENCTEVISMLRSTKIKTVPLMNFEKVTSANAVFQSCSELETIPALDLRSATTLFQFVDYCKKLTECWIRNIKVNLQVGSGTTWGHLLTVDSLIHLIKELRDTGSTKTLTMGNANLEKIANTYVKTVAITDEMRAEDDLIDEKLPFVVCESTDEGAMLITDYVQLKNWSIK